MTFMRRRQANAMKAAERPAMRIGPVEPIVAPIAVVWAEPPKIKWSQINDPQSWTQPPAEVLPAVPKGSCAKCGKHIGKGLHFHQRACRGAA